MAKIICCGKWTALNSEARKGTSPFAGSGLGASAGELEVPDVVTSSPGEEIEVGEVKPLESSDEGSAVAERVVTPMAKGFGAGPARAR